MKVIWVTGASSGLGHQIANQAIEKGYTVVSLARSFNQNWTIENQSMKVYFDVTKPKEWDSIITRLCQEGLSPDVLINNAGIGLFKYSWDLSEAEVEQMLAVNVTGFIQLSNRISQLMIKKKRGHIIQIGSQAGKLTTAKASVYGATKHAVIGYSNGLRLELKPYQIKVSVVNPGPIATPFLASADPSGNYEKAIGRWLLQPEAVAKKVVSLIEKPKREVNLPWWMNVATKAHSLSPSLFERLAYSFLAKK